MKPSVASVRGPFVAAALFTFGGACAAPTQSGGVEVRSGADDRLGILCRWRRGDEAQRDVCSPGEAATTKPSRVRRIAKETDKLKGPQATGALGDYLLENDEVAVVIAQINPGEAKGAGGGSLIDAADAGPRRRLDELGSLSARLGGSMLPRYESLTTGVDKDGAAWIVVKGREASDEHLTIVTRYALGPADRAVMITTVVENTGPSPVGLLDLGDAVVWGAADVLLPGTEPSATGEIKGPYVAGVGSDVAYLLAPVKDVEVSSLTRGGSSDVVIERDVTLPPGGRAHVDRVFAIAGRGDPVAVATEFFFMQGGSPGGLFVKLVDAGGAALVPPPDGRLFLDRKSPSGEAREPHAPPSVAWWMRAVRVAEDPSIIGGEVPPGRYELRFEGGGRRSSPGASIEIKAGEVVKRTLEVSNAVQP